MAQPVDLGTPGLAMIAYIRPPRRIPWFLRLAIWISERKTGKEMLVARILAWVPKAAIGSGLLESFVAHNDETVSERLLKLVRMQVSFKASCPFCIDMNGEEYAALQITKQETRVLQGLEDIDDVESLSDKEKWALKYALALTKTPVEIPATLLDGVLGAFTERELVLLVSTIAQVNFWARLIQGVGVPPAGFSSACTELRLDEYTTRS
jgi:alkylhydroperoxidase family enzyme